jgi:hypothetical protein
MRSIESENKAVTKDREQSHCVMENFGATKNHEFKEDKGAHVSSAFRRESSTWCKMIKSSIQLSRLLSHTNDLPYFVLE